MRLGLPPDTAMRVTALACFAATAILLFGFVRRFAGTLAAFVALGVFLFSPFGLLWSRASLIEYLATAAAVGYVWAALEWRERRGAGSPSSRCSRGRSPASSRSRRVSST